MNYLIAWKNAFLDMDTIRVLKEMREHHQNQHRVIRDKHKTPKEEENLPAHARAAIYRHDDFAEACTKAIAAISGTK